MTASAFTTGSMDVCTPLATAVPAPLDPAFAPVTVTSTLLTPVVHQQTP